MFIVRFNLLSGNAVKPVGTRGTRSGLSAAPPPNNFENPRKMKISVLYIEQCNNHTKNLGILNLASYVHGFQIGQI